MIHSFVFSDRFILVGVVMESLGKLGARWKCTKNICIYTNLEYPVH